MYKEELIVGEPQNYIISLTGGAVKIDGMLIDNDQVAKIIRVLMPLKDTKKELIILTNK